jgi:hypothetical protein
LCSILHQHIWAGTRSDKFTSRLRVLAGPKRRHFSYRKIDRISEACQLEVFVSWSSHAWLNGRLKVTSCHHLKIHGTLEQSASRANLLNQEQLPVSAQLKLIKL